MVLPDKKGEALGVEVDEGLKAGDDVAESPPLVPSVELKPVLGEDEGVALFPLSENEGVVGFSLVLGVVGADWGMLGKDSRRAAPNEEEGLKGFRPPKPVGCDVNGAIEGDPGDPDEVAFVVAVA